MPSPRLDPPAPGPHGALKYPGSFPALRQDIESVCEPSSVQFLLRLHRSIIFRYRIEYGECDGGFEAWSIVTHCFNLKRLKNGIKCMDWNGLEVDLLEPATRMVETEMKSLEEKASFEHGRRRKNTLGRIEHRRIVLLSGKQVVATNVSSVGEYIVCAKGCLEGFEDNLLYVGGRPLSIDRQDLVERLWTVEEDLETPVSGSDSSCESGTEEGWEGYPGGRDGVAAPTLTPGFADGLIEKMDVDERQVLSDALERAKH